MASRSGSTARIAPNAPATDESTIHVAEFDELVFAVFNSRNWDEFPRFHSPHLIVHWPDGRTSEGLEPYLRDLKEALSTCPDLRVIEHNVRIGQGHWTSVVGTVEGTFVHPMRLPSGLVVPPTAKRFQLALSTVAHWENRLITEQYLFWDNQSYLQQIGVVPGQGTTIDISGPMPG